MFGVSIVICCYNSSARIVPTLQHLKAQIGVADIKWEVLVIDNGSTDETALVATKLWGADGPVELRVVTEPEPGLSKARARGLSEAKYDLVSLVDDDNWVCHDWVRIITEIMQEYPQVGACGGTTVAVFEDTPPPWFWKHARSYAVGSHSPSAADVTDTKGYLWGAGLTLKKSAWLKLLSSGFKSLLSDRKGVSLASGGDTELCLALRMAGWRLFYEPRLSLQHYMPRSRLSWDYLRRLRYSMGASSVVLDAYKFAMQPAAQPLRRRILQNWGVQMFRNLLELFPLLPFILRRRTDSNEGDSQELRTEWLLGRLSVLWKRPFQYQLDIKTIAKAAWNTLR